MKSLISRIRQYLGWRSLVGLLSGAVAGYAYWYFYGCTEGCAITGSPVNSTLYFAFMGYMVAGLFPEKRSGKQPEAGEQRS